MRQLLQPSFDDVPLVTENEIDGIIQGKIVHKQNVQDFPPKLWMEILSYLPRGSAGKLIGVNRFLFELGMNELYEEVRLTNFEGAGIRTFQQIGQTSIASRVRRLYIRPTFLLELDHRRKAIDYKNESTSDRKSRKSRIRTFLRTACRSLAGCSHLKEMTVVIRDQYISGMLERFLRVLMKYIGTGLKVLTIDMTLPSFLSIFRVFNPKFLFKLTTLIINVTNSRLKISRTQTRQARIASLYIIRPLTTTLRSLTLEVIDSDIPELFQKLGRLPLLRYFELRGEFGFYTLLRSIHFDTFLQLNAENLEHLIIQEPKVEVAPLEMLSGWYDGRKRQLH